jgi:hypothetical protein
MDLGLVSILEAANSSLREKCPDGEIRLMASADFEKGVLECLGSLSETGKITKEEF